MGFTVQQLVPAALTDLLSKSSQRVAEQLPVHIGEVGGLVTARHELFSRFDSICEVRRGDVECAHARMELLERTRVVDR